MCDPIVTKSTLCEDTETSIKLQAEIAQQPLSANLNDYMVSKQRLHEECFINMNNELNYLNMTSKNELSEIMDILKQEMLELEVKMCEVCEVEINTEEEWNFLQEKFNKISLRVNKHLEEFNMDLINLEKNRCENIKKVVSRFKKECKNIQFFGLKDIEQTFEKFCIELNRSTLNNLTLHEDLKLTLMLNAMAMASKYSHKLKLKADELAGDRDVQLRQTAMVEQAKGIVAQAMSNLIVSHSGTKEELNRVVVNLLQRISTFLEAIGLTNDAKSGDEVFLEYILKEIESRFEAVKTCYYDVCAVVSTTISHLEDSYENEKIAFTLHLQKEFTLKEGEDFSPGIQILETKKTKILDGLQFWQKVLKELDLVLQNAKCFTSDINTFLLDNLAIQKKYRLDLYTNLESCYQRCVKKEQEFNAKIKTQIKALRESPDKTKLESSSKMLTEIFVAISEMWRENFDDNTNIIEDFKIKNDSSAVHQRLTCANDLLLRYPKNLWDPVDFTILEQGEINSLIFECIDCIVFLKKTLTDLYDNVEKYVSTLEYEINEKYKLLLKDVTVSIMDKYEKIVNEVHIKTESCVSIKKIRLAELEIHSERLKSHQAGVNLIVNSETATYEGIRSDHKSKLQEFNDKIANFNKTHEITNQVQIKNAILELENEWDELSMSLKNRICDTKLIFQHKFESLKHSNGLFQKTANHFKNGGNFSQNEFSSLTKELNQLDKVILNQSKTLSDKYNKLLQDFPRQELDSTLRILYDKLNMVKLNCRVDEVLSLTRMELRTEILGIRNLLETFSIKIQGLNSLGKLDDNLLNELALLAKSILGDLALTVSLEFDKSLRKSFSLGPPSKQNKGGKSKKSTKESYVLQPLFDSLPQEEFKEETNVLSRAKQIISAKYSLLIQLIEDSLKPKLTEAIKLKKKEPKQDTASGQIVERIDIIKHVLLLYNEECETSWFDLAKEFNRQLAVLRSIITNMSEQMLNKTYDSYAERLNFTESEHRSVVLKLVNEGTSELNRLRKSVLLPLAHPRYQDKLENIHRQANAITRSTIKSCKDLVCGYQEDLLGKHNNYVDELTNLKKMLENNQKIFFCTISCDELAVKLEELEIVLANLSVKDQLGNEDLLKNKLSKIDDEFFHTNSNEAKRNTEQMEYFKYPLSIWADYETTRPNLKVKCIDFDQCTSNCVISLATSKLKDSVVKIQTMYKNAEENYKNVEKLLGVSRRDLKFIIDQAKDFYLKICS